MLVADGVVLQGELEWILSSHTQSPHTVAHAKLNDLVRQEHGMVRDFLLVFIEKFYLTFTIIFIGGNTFFSRLSIFSFI